MIKIAITCVMGLIINAIWQAFAVNIPDWCNVFCLGPVILVFIANFLKPKEAFICAFICGYIIDATFGYFIGVNIFLMMFLSVLLSFFNFHELKLNNYSLVYYVVIFSFIYRLSLLVFSLIFLQGSANLFIVSMIFGPMVDGIFSVLIFWVLVKILQLSKAFDKSEYYIKRNGYYP